MPSNKIWLIALILIILVSIAGIIYWRHTRIVSRRYRPPEKRVIAAVVKKKAPLPKVVKRFANPKVAVVMDDFGYNKNNLEEFFGIKRPITLSVLPNLRYSTEIAGLARVNGYEVILHLPLEPRRKDVRQEVDTINSRMNEKEIKAKLDSAIESVPGLSGVSNHMGSKSTEEKELMTVILGNLKLHKLYFFDSLTSQRSVCQQTAKQLSVRYAKRDIFLDMGSSNDMDYIRRQVLGLRSLAFRGGRAIAVCHDRPNTIRVLKEMMPQLSDDGIEFVFLSELVK